MICSLARKPHRSPTRHRHRDAGLGQWKSCAADPYGVLDLSLEISALRPHVGKSRLDRGVDLPGDKYEAVRSRSTRWRPLTRYESGTQSLGFAPTWRRIARLDAAAEASARLTLLKRRGRPSFASTFHEWQRIARCNAPGLGQRRSGGRGEPDPRRPLRTVRGVTHLRMYRPCELSHQLLGTTVGIIDHRLALRLDAEAALALLVGGDAIAGDELASVRGVPNCQPDGRLVAADSSSSGGNTSATNAATVAVWPLRFSKSSATGNEPLASALTWQDGDHSTAPVPPTPS